MFKLRRKQKRPKKVGVLIAVPTLDAKVSAKIAFELTRAGYLSRDPDHPFVYEPFMPCGTSPVEHARNKAVRHFLDKTDHEYLYWWDADQTPPENWPDLLGVGDIVTGMTWMFRVEERATARLQFNQFKTDENGRSTTIMPTSFAEPYSIDWCGTACMVVRRKVFESIGGTPFETVYAPDGERQEGEDIRFCRKARAAGFRVTADPRVVFGHMKEVDLQKVYETLVEMSNRALAAGRSQALQAIKAALPKMDLTAEQLAVLAKEFAGVTDAQERGEADANPAAAGHRGVQAGRGHRDNGPHGAGMEGEGLRGGRDGDGAGAGTVIAGAFARHAEEERPEAESLTERS